MDGGADAKMELMALHRKGAWAFHEQQLDQLLAHANCVAMPREEVVKHRLKIRRAYCTSCEEYWIQLNEEEKKSRVAQRAAAARQMAEAVKQWAAAEEQRIARSDELFKKFYSMLVFQEDQRIAAEAAAQLAIQQLAASCASQAHEVTTLRADVSDLQATLAAVESKYEQLIVEVSTLSAQHGAAGVAVKAEEIAVHADQQITPDITIHESVDLASLATVAFSPVTVEAEPEDLSQDAELSLATLDFELQGLAAAVPEFSPEAAGIPPFLQRGVGGRVFAGELMRSQRLADKPMRRWDPAEVGSGAEPRAGARRRKFDPGRLDLKHVRGGSL